MDTSRPSACPAMTSACPAGPRINTVSRRPANRVDQPTLALTETDAVILEAAADKADPGESPRHGASLPSSRWPILCRTTGRSATRAQRCLRSSGRTAAHEAPRLPAGMALIAGTLSRSMGMHGRRCGWVSGGRGHEAPRGRVCRRRTGSLPARRCRGQGRVLRRDRRAPHP